MPWWWVAGLGAAVGAGTGLLLRRGGYRRGEERDRPAPPAAAVAVAAAGLAAGWGLLAAAAGDPVTAGAGLLFSLAGLIAGWIDVDVHRIPNLVTGPAALVLAGGLAAAAGLSGDWPRFGRALLAGVALLVGFAVLTVLSSFGAGDAKLAGVAGLVLGWAGWPTVIAGLLAGFLAAAVVAVALLAGGRSRHSHLAFGPPLTIGTVVALLL